MKIENHLRIVQVPFKAIVCALEVEPAKASGGNLASGSSAWGGPKRWSSQRPSSCNRNSNSCRPWLTARVASGGPLCAWSKCGLWEICPLIHKRPPPCSTAGRQPTFPTQALPFWGPPSLLQGGKRPNLYIFVWSGSNAGWKAFMKKFRLLS